MFTGIIETLGKITDIKHENSNVHLTVRSMISEQLKIDQSVSHNGVCLTVVDQTEDKHTVTAISETIQKSNLGNLQMGDTINLERCTQLGDRLDGHIVQGHVDETVECLRVESLNGSWKFTFSMPDRSAALLIPQGSITINGVSLTVANLNEESFSVAIIPYTYEHTTFGTMKKGDKVNIEYDVIGKYVVRQFELRDKKRG